MLARLIVPNRLSSSSYFGPCPAFPLRPSGPDKRVLEDRGEPFSHDHKMKMTAYLPSSSLVLLPLLRPSPLGLIITHFVSFLSALSRSSYNPPSPPVWRSEKSWPRSCSLGPNPTDTREGLAEREIIFETVISTRIRLRRIKCGV